MKIKALRTFPLLLPMKKPLKMARQMITTAETIIVRIDTDEGISGFGESAAAVSFSGETLASMKYVLEKYIKPLLLGENPFNLEKIHMAMEKAIAHNYGAKSAADIALHDLISKAMGIPLYQYLGGRVRESVRITWHVANADYDLDMETFAEGVDIGYEVYKLKVGTADTDQEMKTIEGFRKKFENLDLRLDANQGLSLTTAVPFIRKTEPFKITFFEQPIDYRHLAGMAKIRAAVKVPIAADEGIFTAYDAVAIYEAKSADIISLKLMKAGGIAPLIKAAHVCYTLGLPIQMASKIAETSVATAAAVHLGVSLPQVEYDCGTTNHYLSDDVVSQPLIPIKGRIKPSAVPGLGVEVLEEKLKEYTIDL